MSEWKNVRTIQHPAWPDLTMDLEINPITLEFRLQILEQTFIDKDAEQVLQQVRAYLHSLPAPGDWEPMIGLAWYNRRMEATRWWYRVEENGTAVQHPWVASPKEILLSRISTLRYHERYYTQARPPCRHHDGLSSYYHLLYTPDVWTHIEELVSLFNNAQTTLKSVLDAVSTSPRASLQEWEAHVLALWPQFSEWSVKAGANDVKEEEKASLSKEGDE